VGTRGNFLLLRSLCRFPISRFRRKGASSHTHYTVAREEDQITMAIFNSTIFMVSVMVCVLSPVKDLESFLIVSSNHQKRTSSSLAPSSSYIATRCYSTATTSIPTDDDIEKARSMMPEIVDKMPDPFPSKNLKHKYYMLRHGQSLANIAEIISSSRSLAYSDKHGLTSFGYEQGKESANQLLDVLEQDIIQAGKQNKIIFVSSPFARAKQTAIACIDGLMNNKDNQQKIETMGLTIEKDITFEHGLMERYFGRLDNDSIYTCE
jgi:hypothetical protein